MRQLVAEKTSKREAAVAAKDMDAIASLTSELRHLDAELRYVDAKLRMSEADHKLYLREFKEQVRGGRRCDFGR